jgi:hypothetical protein
VSRPISTRKFSETEHGKLTPEHQHNRYSLPFPDIAMVPQLIFKAEFTWTHVCELTGVTETLVMDGKPATSVDV